MDAFDFSLLQTDLQELEEKLQQYGSKPVKDEISLNQLFIDHLGVRWVTYPSGPRPCCWPLAVSR